MTRRVVTRASQTAVDVVVLALCLLVAVGLRYDWVVPSSMQRNVVASLPYVVLIEYGALVYFGVHRFSWRHVGLREVSRIGAALVVSTAVLVGVRLGAEALRETYFFARYAQLPLSSLLVNLLLASFAVAGVRVLRRVTAERSRAFERRKLPASAVPTLLVGAGDAGLAVAKEIRARPDLGILGLGFLDDDRQKRGTLLHGLPVLGTTAELAAVATMLGARQVLITIADAPGRTVREVTRACDEVGLPVKLIPGLHEIVGGHVNLTRLREVAIEDLLRRDSIRLEVDALQGSICGRTVLVTGSGGSIGSELCRQIGQFAPRKLVLVERSEFALFEVGRELVRRFPAIEIVQVIGDVCNRARMANMFAEHRPEYVFHSAAYKHVPMMEANAAEAVRNNVLGTKRIADLAHEHGAERFVLISTDKAVNPTSIMGATKRAAEQYIEAMASRSETRFCAVRFGNVLGSSGSVVPIFKEQIAAGGPVTVTHPDMVRFFMTIPEACQLVLQAGAMSGSGEVFILDMGEPVAIVDLAKDLIRLSGLRPDEDIEIVFTGVRPGEKLVEELATADEQVDRTRHPKIFVGRLASRVQRGAVARFQELDRVAPQLDDGTARRWLEDQVPEYAQRSGEPVAVDSGPEGKAAPRGQLAVGLG